MTDELKLHFERASSAFLKNEVDLILSGVNERTLCGSLKDYIRSELDETRFKVYRVDVEYNRNKGSDNKRKVKTILNEDHEVDRITCDLIVHSRGEIPSHDNLIALEMKRSTHPIDEKESDKGRLRSLTMDVPDGWRIAGTTTLPIHVCGYSLGVYYEIDTDRRTVSILYFESGQQQQSTQVPF